MLGFEGELEHVVSVAFVHEEGGAVLPDPSLDGEAAREPIARTPRPSATKTLRRDHKLDGFILGEEGTFDGSTRNREVPTG